MVLVVSSLGNSVSKIFQETSDNAGIGPPGEARPGNLHNSCIHFQVVGLDRQIAPIPSSADKCTIPRGDCASGCALSITSGTTWGGRGCECNQPPQKISASTKVRTARLLHSDIQSMTPSSAGSCTFRVPRADRGEISGALELSTLAQITTEFRTISPVRPVTHIPHTFLLDEREPVRTRDSISVWYVTAEVFVYGMAIDSGL